MTESQADLGTSPSDPANPRPRPQISHWSSFFPLIVPNYSVVPVVIVFPTHAIDQAFAGNGAGTVAVLCVSPLDLLKVKS
ncbi:hypothetical protein BJY52DRAFT_1255833 [Lactarius psammicola]|nr:hypothetical protein BJY52DRAFT_1255833 [Lactarius psammicola]